MNSINLYEHTPNIPVRILERDYPSGSFYLHWHENIEILYPINDTSGKKYTHTHF